MADDKSCYAVSNVYTRFKRGDTMKSTFRKLMIGAVAMLAIAALIAIVGCTSSSASSSASASASSGPLPASDVQQTEDQTSYNKPFYVLVVGNDTRLGTVDIVKPTWADGNARSDTCMLVRIDPVNYKIALITVPRDTAAWVDGVKTKMNYSYQVHGIDGILEQVEELTGVKPRYYLDMTFVQFENFVNELGGITVDVPCDMSLQDIVGGDMISISAGEQKLDGIEALVFARIRKIFAYNQDAVRQTNDRALVQSGITYVACNPSVAKLAVDAVIANSDSNWDKEDLLTLVELFCNHANEIEFVSGTGPYLGGMDDEAGVWLADRDEDTWKDIIETVENGGSPTDIVELPELILS